MPSLVGRTREELRVSVGHNLGAVFTGTTSSTGHSDGTKLYDTSRPGGNDDHNGKWVVITSGTNDGEIRQVTNYVSSTGEVEVRTAFTAQVANSVTFELWDQVYPPARIHDIMNQSIIEATGRVYDPEEDVSLHGDGSQARFDLPSEFSMLQRVEYRSSVDSTRMLSCSAAMDEQSTLVATTLDGAITSTSATSVPVASATPLRADQQIMVGSEKMTISSIASNTLTVSRGAGETTPATHSDGVSVFLFPVVDTKIKKQGTASNQFVIPAAASADQIVTDSISSKDISKYDYLEGWIKITRTGEATTTAADLAILLDNTANCASPLEELDIQALTDDTWTFFRVKLANPELDVAIISIGLKYDVDLGACTIWLDDISVVRNDTAIWRRLPKHLWSVDKEARDLILTPEGRGLVGSSLIKLVGGDDPALFTAESSATELDDFYVIARTTGLALASASGGPSTDPDSKRTHAGYWFGMAASRMRSWPPLKDIRRVE